MLSCITAAEENQGGSALRCWERRAGSEGPSIRGTWLDASSMDASSMCKHVLYAMSCLIYLTPVPEIIPADLF